MSYGVDTRLLRATGELLAAGRGTFGATEVNRLFGAALEDDTVRRAEMVALLVVYVMVYPIADQSARTRFEKLVGIAREDHPDVEDWVLRSFSRPLLHRAVTLVAGRGRHHKVSKQDVLSLMLQAYRSGQDGAEISPDEGLAFLAIREVLDGRLAPDAQATFDELCEAARADGCSLGSATSSPGAPSPGPGPGRQCGACSGMGSVSCSSCGGYGYHRRTGSRTRYDGSIEYYEEQVPCSCSGGRVRCSACGGAGRR